MTMITRSIVLVDEDCIACDVVFAMPERLMRELRQTGATFYCPRGHSMVYDDNENDRLRKQVERLQAQRVHADDQRKAAERALMAQKGQNTKLRNRIANGVCPCCHRSFVNLRRHMTAKHPDFTENPTC